MASAQVNNGRFKERQHFQPQGTKHNKTLRRVNTHRNTKHTPTITEVLIYHQTLQRTEIWHKIRQLGNVVINNLVKSIGIVFGTCWSFQPSNKDTRLHGNPDMGWERPLSAEQCLASPLSASSSFKTKGSRAAHFMTRGQLGQPFV